MNYIECKDCAYQYDCERTYLGGCTDGKEWEQEEKKMTDEEIVKALEFCINNVCSLKCPIRNDTSCVQTLRIQALDLINRQKAEIERLTGEIQKATETTITASRCFTRMETLYKLKCQELEIANKKLEELKGGKVD